MKNLEEKKKEEDMLSTIKAAQEFHDNIIITILETKNKKIRKKELKNFAALITILIYSLRKQGQIENIIGINKILIDKLSPRFGVQRFSQKELDEQNEEYFGYFKKIDNMFNDFLIPNPSNLLDFFKVKQDLFDENPPITQSNEKISNSKKYFQNLSYFNDYLSCISDFYESFLLLCLFILILLKLNHPDHNNSEISNYIKELEEGRKKSTRELYYDKGKGKKLIYDHLQELKLPDDQKKGLISFFETVFGNEGLRELRNKKIHHYGEENKMNLNYDKYLEVTFSTGNKRKFSLEEIYVEKINIQFIVYLGFYIVNSLFYNMLYHLLESERLENEGKKDLNDG